METSAISKGGTAVLQVPFENEPGGQKLQGGVKCGKNSGVTVTSRGHDRVDVETSFRGMYANKNKGPEERERNKVLARYPSNLSQTSTGQKGGSFV